MGTLLRHICSLVWRKCPKDESLIFIDSEYEPKTITPLINYSSLSTLALSPLTWALDQCDMSSGGMNWTQVSPRYAIYQEQATYTVNEVCFK